MKAVAAIWSVALLAATAFAQNGEPTVSPTEEYDYIIIGGGTAGLTVADRLTENGKFTVLVMEYGTYDNSSSVTTVARGFSGIINQTHLFSFSSVPQTNLANRTTTVIVGKALGGSSAVNGFQVQRGSKGNYNMWANLFQDDAMTWGWDAMLARFKKAWRMQPPNDDTAKALGIKTDGQYWGPSMAGDGEIGTRGIWASFPTENFPVLKILLEAFKSLPNIAFPKDSGAGETGVFWYPESADPHTYTRSHSRTGHWDGISNERTNYYTMTGVKAIEVTFDADMNANGVIYIPSNATEITEDNVKVINAKKEVILAAGAIHTPQILQCSGIGQSDVLLQGGINPKVELPGVGMNFQDHPYNIGASWKWNNLTLHPTVDDLQTNQTYITAARDQFAANRTGPNTIASGNLASFLPLSVISSELAETIAQKLESQNNTAYHLSNDPTVLAGYEAQMKLMAKGFREGSIATYNLFLRGGVSESAIVDLTPLSRGRVQINTADPRLSEPLVDYCALCNPLDLDIMIEFTKYTRKYFSLPDFASLDPEETLPGTGVQSDDDIAEYINKNVSPSTFHPVGTTAMMPRELGGVVDKELKVYGAKQLRVVDASVFPFITGAYTQQTVYAVAEGAAEMILKDA